MNYSEELQKLIGCLSSINEYKKLIQPYKKNLQQGHLNAAKMIIDAVL